MSDENAEVGADMAELLALRQQLAHAHAEVYLWRTWYANLRMDFGGVTDDPVDPDQHHSWDWLEAHRPAPEAVAGEFTPEQAGTALNQPAPERGWIEPRDPQDVFAEFWAALVADEHGHLIHDKVLAELYDYAMFLEFGSMVYDHVTGAQVSKINTHPEIVCALADDYVERAINEALTEVGALKTSHEEGGDDASARQTE